MEILSENFCFDGTQGVYKHYSECCKCDMIFAVYLPPQAKVKSVPVLWYLSGLTCTHENAMVKAAAQGWAAENGIALIFPDPDDVKELMQHKRREDMLSIRDNQQAKHSSGHRHK